MDLVYPFWNDADMIVVASPVYYGSFSSQTHTLVHRTYASHKPKKIARRWRYSFVQAPAMYMNMPREFITTT